VDDASSSILGVALDVKVFYFNPKLFYHNRLLEFINYFNLCGSVTFSTDGVQSHPATDLTLYQQEICFLSLLNWSVAEMEGYFKSHENPFHRRGASVGAINMARQMITKKLGCLTPSEECFNQSLKEQGLHCILPLSLFANPYLSILREMS
jgi:hypothetical protein